MVEENKASLEQNTSEAKKEKIVKQKLSPVYDLLEGAIKTWWKNLMKFIKVYLWGVLFALIPGVVVIVLVVITRIISEPDLNAQASLTSFGGINPILGFLFVTAGIACFLIALYLIIRAYIGMFILVKHNYEGNELEIFKETKKYFWPYFWLSVLTTILVLLWTLLLIIPGIIYSIFYSFAIYAFFFDGLTGMKAIRRSISLVKNYWWEVFGRFAVIGIALYVVTLVFSIPLYMTKETSVFYDIWTGVTQILSFIIGPISIIYSYQIYKELVEIKK